MKILITIFISLISLASFARDYTPMDGYSKDPLEEPVFDYAKVVVDTAAFNNWLNANYSKMNSQNMQGPREHLYYLIGSYVSELNKKNGIILPDEHDLILSTLLSWGERLGVYGAHLFYNRIKAENMQAQTPLMKVAEGIEISVENDMLKIADKKGAWATRVPYYFMIGAVNEFNATNGMETQLLTISTGAVKDNSAAGRSQSTLMLIFSPTKEARAFQDYWLTQFEISANIDRKPIGINKYQSVYLYNEAALLHKEITFIPSANGSLLVAYLGMDGAYQKNRQHFLDFVAQVK